MGILYKYTAGDDPVKWFLEDLTISYTPPVNLNDPFECGLHTGEFFDKFGIGINQRYLQGLNTTKEDLRHFNSYAIRVVTQRTSNQIYGILSLTPVADNLLMWSHYANNHKGFVVGFDSAHRFFNPREDDGRSKLVSVRYDDKRVVSGLRKGVLFQHGEVTQEFEYEIFNYFFLKSRLWSYEKEVRMVAMTNNHKLFRDPKRIGVTQFPPEAVTEIIIGSRASIETVRRIYALHAANFPHAELKVAWLDPHQFRVNTRLAPDLQFMERFPKVWTDPLLPHPPFGKG